MVFENVTIFNDNIYLPLFSLRQSRLRLNCKRATDWTGRMDAPGFVIMGNKLASDFEKAAEDIRLMFDIEKADRTDLRDYARHVIGFQRRDYLDNLLISDIEQFEFYQGMIQQKGAPGVFEKLMRSIRASNNSNLQFLEEWAVRLNDYGAPIDPFMIFKCGRPISAIIPRLCVCVPNPRRAVDMDRVFRPRPRAGSIIHRAPISLPCGQTMRRPCCRRLGRYG